MKRTSPLKKFYLILFGLLIISFVLGIFYSKFNYQDDTYDYLTLVNDFTSNINTFHLGNIWYPIIILACSLVFSYFIIGPIILIIYFCYDLFSFGFISYIFFRIYLFKGILLSLTYFLTYKLLTYFLLILFLVLSLKISYLIFSKYILKKNQDYHLALEMNFHKSLKVLLVILINNFILYFFGGYILNTLTFFLH